MGQSKASLFRYSTNELSEFAKALAHPARIAIIEHLLTSPDCICGDIVKSLPLSQSTVSQHLKELKRIGLIKGAIDGPKVCYCIDADNWNKMKLAFTSLFMKELQCADDECY